jgi:hypothetical protein
VTSRRRSGSFALARLKAVHEERLEVVKTLFETVVVQFERSNAFVLLGDNLVQTLYGGEGNPVRIDGGDATRIRT